MSMSTEEPGVGPAALAGKAGPTHPPLDVSVPEPGSSPAVYQAGFNGWLAFADVLSEVSPGIADVMMAGAYVARATLEEQIPSLLDGLDEALGLSRSGLDGVAAALGADNLELTPEAAAEMLFANTSGAVQALQESPNKFALIDEAIHDFLKTRLIRDSASIFEETRRQLSEHQPRTDFAHWTATCSLDLPSVLGSGQQPIYCARRGHRGLGTNLRALEYTYYPQLRTGFEGVVTADGAVGVGGGYRVDIDEKLPKQFVRTLEPQDQGQGWAYALYLIEGTRSKTVAKLVSTLPGQRKRLQDKIAKQVESSKQRFESVLLNLPWGIPASLINPVVGLITAAAQALVPVILNQIIKRFGEARLTPWTIWHTVLMGSEWVPVSIFTIAGRDATTPPLCRLVKGPGDEWTPDDDYGGYRTAELGASRFMIGETEIPTGSIDGAWFGLVANHGQPLAWQEPLQTRGGFRILLPHLDRSLDTQDRELLDKDRYKRLAAKSKKVYISAIRADVRLQFEAADNPWLSGTAVRRPRGAGGEL